MSNHGKSARCMGSYVSLRDRQSSSPEHQITVDLIGGEQSQPRVLVTVCVAQLGLRVRVRRHQASHVRVLAPGTQRRRCLERCVRSGLQALRRHYLLQAFPNTRLAFGRGRSRGLRLLLRLLLDGLLLGARRRLLRGTGPVGFVVLLFGLGPGTLLAHCWRRRRTTTSPQDAHRRAVKSLS